ncbi:6-bladed beta-propeller [Gemmatimonadota bacterium]
MKDFRYPGALVLLCMSLAIGCSSTTADREGWIHETSIDGSMTTIRTLSGSVWGGSARLVEEASIGMEEGPDEYLLGQVASLAAHEGRIFILDRQVPVLRVYDWDGTFITDVGGSGNGPGEMQSPTSVRVNPADGTIYVRDGSQGRLNVYSPDGVSIDTWPLRSGFMTSRQLVMTIDGGLYTSSWIEDEDAEGIMDYRSSMNRIGPEGMTGDYMAAPDYGLEGWTIEYQGENTYISNPVPFSPDEQWAMSPLGVMIGGVSTDYQIDVFHVDGSITRIEREWEKIPVEPGEQRWYRARATANMRSMAPGWAWNGREVPNFKPPFDGFMTDPDGRIWVLRQGPGIPVEGCDPDPDDRVDFRSNPCWLETWFVDVFDNDGRFLGEVDLPEGFLTYPEPFIQGSTVIAQSEGEDGVPLVKRYRLVLPDEHE